MKPSKRLGYAVLGLGHISQRAILPAFRHSKKSRLVAVVSGDVSKAESLASKFGASQHCTYAELDRCLDNPEVGAVYIAAENGRHPHLAFQAAAHDKHVLCEKPLANTVEECRQMVEACHKNSVRLMTAYRKYFEPSSVACKKLVVSEKLGRLRTIHTAFTNVLPPAARAWHYDARLAGGGSLMDLGIYCVNMARWLAGREPEEASAQIWTTDPARFASVEENIAFQLQFPGGLCMQGASSFTAAKASFLHIHGENGWAALDPAYAYNEEHHLFGKIAGKWFEKRFPPVEEFHLEMDHLADCVRRKRDPEPDGVTGLRDIAAIEAIYRAAKMGAPVAIRMPS